MRRRTGLLDALMDVGARLPWGVTMALAIVLFGALHYLAGLTPAVPDGTSKLGLFTARQLITTFASILQYVLPIGLLIGAAVSFIRRRRGMNLLADAAADPTSSINSLRWQDFERLVGASFERSGFAVEHTGGGGADGGVDLVLTKGRELTLVQCKQWRAQKVGVTTVRELYGVMAARGAARGIVITAGDFTPDAREFSSGRNIDLLNGRALAGVLRNPGGSEAITALPDSPMCPSCGSKMIERVARKGPTAGQSFWGCETYPRCRATLPIQKPWAG
jgi:restriction system protein